MWRVTCVTCARFAVGLNDSQLQLAASWLSLVAVKLLPVTGSAARQ